MKTGFVCVHVAIVVVSLTVRADEVTGCKRITPDALTSPPAVLPPPAQSIPVQRVGSAANGAGAEVRIKIYDETHLPEMVLAEVFDGLRLILREANVPSCAAAGDLADPVASEFMYVAPPRDDDRAATPCGARRDIALKIIGASPWGLPPTVLGMSSPFAGFGLNVLIFNDHVREAVRSNGQSYATVLAFAMAHEIGHVLLRSGAHTPWGIMSGVWTAYEYGEMSGHGLRFDTEAAKAIRTNLALPACPAPVPVWAFRSSR